MINNKRCICEVGVGHITVAYGALYWDKINEFEIMMFEPHPVYYAQLVEACNNRPNVKIYNVAIGDKRGKAKLCDVETSSYLKDTDSPILQVMTKSPSSEHKKYKKKNYIEVDVKLISDFDHGHIDFLRIDTEGTEWYTLKYLVSRPDMISIETHGHDAKYINPFLYEIEDWMRKERYSKVSFDNTDSVYQKIR